MNRKFFSLIEMIILISLLATLAAMTLPSLSRAKEYAYDISCKNNIRHMAISVRHYMADYKNKFPAPPSGYWMDDFSATSYPYTRSLRLYICSKSSTKITNSSNLNGGTDYYTCGNATDNDPNMGGGNSPYKIDINNPGNSPAMISFRNAMATARRSIYENMRGENNKRNRNHLGYFNYINIENMRMEKTNNLYGWFWLDRKREIVYITQNPTYSYTY